MSVRINKVAWKSVDWAWNGGAVCVEKWRYRVGFADEITDYLAAVQAAMGVDDARGERAGWDVES